MEPFMELPGPKALIVAEAACQRRHRGLLSVRRSTVQDGARRGDGRVLGRDKHVVAVNREDRV